MKRILTSLSFKLTLLIVLAQLTITATTGAFYLSYLTNDAEQRIKAQLKVPGTLMNKGLLNYDAISKRETMQQIIGDDLSEAMIFSYDQTVYQSINNEDIGKNVTQLTRIDLQGFSQQTEDRIIEGADQTGPYIGAITPIYAVVGEAPFLFSYVKIRTQSLERQKNLLGLMIIGSSILTTSLTSLIILFILRQLFLRNIRRLRQAAEKVSRGQFDDNVLSILPITRDEIGDLSESFRSMTLRLRENYQDIAEKEARLRSSVRSLTLGCIIVDDKQAITEINPPALRLFHRYLTKDASDLTNLSQALAPSVDLAASITHCLENGRPQEFKEITFGNHFLHIIITPILLELKHRKADTLGAVILIEDVTEERILERSRDEFFSIASHELRTPLTAIRGNATMIQQYYRDQIKDGQLREMIDDIRESSVRLIEIVTDFLDASRLEQGKMQFKPEVFSIETVIEKIVYELSVVGREKGITITTTADLGTLPRVYADKNRVKQVLYNLVGNAVKFVTQGSVTIAARAEDNHIKISVIDTGRGIEPEFQQILFHKFQQATPSIITRDSTRGTGLGLYISKLLVENMSGKITLEHSEPGKGSTFSFTIPIAPQASSSAN